MRVRHVYLLIGAGVALGVGAGFATEQITPSVYASTASVLVGATGGEPNLATEAELVRSTKTVADARTRLGDGSAGPPQVQPLPGSSVLMIRFEATTAAAAQAGAQAYAEAYLANRGRVARATVNDQIATLLLRLDDVRNQITEINTLIARLPSNATELTTLRATLTSLTTQSADLTTRMNELQTTPVDPGAVIADADLPTVPVRPVRWLYLGGGGVAGLLVGVALVALARSLGARWSRRIRHGTDLARHGEVGLLAELDVLAISAASHDPTARAFNRLRNEVVAELGERDRALMVTAASPGTASMLVAANLAAAFARADNAVVLVGAHVADLGPDLPQVATTLAQIFDVADIPGLTDVLTGRTSLASAIQRAARAPRLRVVTPGGTASATGLLQSEGARSVIDALAQRTRYVVIDAPSTASGADAQSLASAADVALLVVEAGRASHAQVADAVMQLQRVGTRLLGAVVVPRLRPGAMPVIRTGRPGAVEYNTEAWIATGQSALDAPTRRLNQLTRRAAADRRDQRDQPRNDPVVPA